VELGGFGVSLDGHLGITFVNAGPLPWGSNSNGNYTHGPVDLTAFNLAGLGEYRLFVTDGWPLASGAAWDGTITLAGIDALPDNEPVPTLTTPGLVALMLILVAVAVVCARRRTGVA
jgi:hypothetical protein